MQKAQQAVTWASQSQQAVCQVQGVSFPASGAQDDCQKLCVGQAVDPDSDIFIGAVLVGQILNSYSFHLSPNYAPLQAQSQENYIYR